jgi:hypothetical protein
MQALILSWRGSQRSLTTNASPFEKPPRALSLCAVKTSLSDRSRYRFGRRPPRSALPLEPKFLATLSHLKPIPVRILEPRGVTPGILEDLGWVELRSAGSQGLERRLAILHLDGINGGPRLAARWCPRPQNEVEILPFDADGQESRSRVG